MENRENHFVREEREESAFCNHKHRLIPHEYCLPRIACNANNTYTNELAPHNKEYKNDVLMVSEYVSDLFQHLYDEPAGHGPTFLAWRENLKLKGLTLYKVA